MRFFENTKEGEFFFSDAISMSASHESFDCLLNLGRPILLLFFRTLVLEVFIAGCLFFRVHFFNLPLLVVGCLKSTNDSLPTSLDFLDDTYCSFHIGIESRSFFDDFFLGQVGLFEVNQKFIDDLVAFELILIAIIDKIARDAHLNL